MTAARGPGRPPRASAAETRQRIEHAAREVFGELGYDATTMQAIAARADLTRPAVSHYYVGKEQLYGVIVEQTAAMVAAAGAVNLEGQTSLPKRLSAFFSAAMQTQSRDRSTVAFFVSSTLDSQRHPELSRNQHNPLKTWRAVVRWAVVEAIDSGEITTRTDVSNLVEVLVAVLWGMAFYAGYVGGRDQLAPLVDRLELLLTNQLWEFAD